MKTTMDTFSGYRYADESRTEAHSYLWPRLNAILDKIGSKRLFEIGCGNGATARMLSKRGFSVLGIDASTEGIARANDPNLRIGSAYDDLAAQYGRFPVIISLEVVEHLYYPRTFAKTAFDLLEPGGTAVISTPYHGYLKNLALAASGKMDDHFTALWDGGHIKFWSEKTLGALLREAGFTDIRFERVGRVPPLAKSMFAIARKAPVAAAR
jgi:2-polyprenyl-6-hydroxyphenyl methylase/3-demethylubiquinone-9 3-methyltransferase